MSKRYETSQYNTSKKPRNESTQNSSRHNLRHTQGFERRALQADSSAPKFSRETSKNNYTEKRWIN